MPVQRLLGELPPILCGPILRRVESPSVSVFVALKERRFVELVLYESPAGAAIAPRSARQRTIALGSNLHVLVVTLMLPESEPGLEAGKLHGYNLLFCRRTRGS